MKAARIALRTAAPLAGASGSSSRGRLPREVEEFSRFSPSPLSIKQLLDFGERRDEQGRAGPGRGVRSAGDGCKPAARRRVSPLRGERGDCGGSGVRARRCWGRGRRRSARPPGGARALPALKALPPPGLTPQRQGGGRGAAPRPPPASGTRRPVAGRR